MVKVMEKRKYFRVQEDYSMECSRFSFNSESIAKKFNTRNLSANGLLFESDENFQKGDVVKVELNIPAWEKYKVEFYKFDEKPGEKPLVVIGTVSRVEKNNSGKYNVGIYFSSGIDDGHQMALDKLIQRLLFKAKFHLK